MLSIIELESVPYGSVDALCGAKPLSQQLASQTSPNAEKPISTDVLTPLDRKEQRDSPFTVT